MDNSQNTEPIITEQISPEQVVTEQVTVAETGPVFRSEEPKKGKGMLFGLIFCLVLAAGGIGFGVWAMMDGNARADKLNKQISTLQKQNADLVEQIAELNEKIEGNGGDDEQYIVIEEMGIKIKKSDDLPDMIAEYQDDGGLIIKENESASGLPSEVTLIKATTCDTEELTLGYSAKIELDDVCYLVGEIIPYGTEEYPLTDFLEYVTNPDNYSAI